MTAVRRIEVEIVGDASKLRDELNRATGDAHLALARLRDELDEVLHTPIFESDHVRDGAIILATIVAAGALLVAIVALLVAVWL